MKRALRKLVPVLLLAAATPVRAADDDPVQAFRIPRLDGIAIDAVADDWSDRGFRVPALGALSPDAWEAADRDVQLQLGWSGDGLLVFVDVRDDAIHDPPEDREFWIWDSVEIHVGAAPGSVDRYQVLFAPGLSAGQDTLREEWADRRESATGPLRVTAARKRTADGYAIEALLPWSNLDLAPRVGDRVAVQAHMNDSDTGKGYPNDWAALVWFPRGNASRDPASMFAVEFAEAADPPWVTGRAWAEAAIRGELDPDRAVALLRRSLERVPDEAPLLTDLGRVRLYALNDRAGAAADFAGAAALGRKRGDGHATAEALFRLAMTEAEPERARDRLSEAREALDGAGGFRADYLRARLLFSAAYFAVEETPQSRSAYEAVKQAYTYTKERGYKEFFPQLEGALGRHFLAAGDAVSARKHFEAMLNMTRSQAEARYAREKLADLDGP